MPDHQILEEPLAQGRDPEAAVAEMGRMLVAAGFSPAGNPRPREAAFASPGYRSTRQPAILGAGRLVATARGGKLRVEADMSGATFLARFAVWFPLGLSTVLGLGLPLMLNHTISPAYWVIPVPWLVIGPLMARAIRGRCERALVAAARHAAG